MPVRMNPFISPSAARCHADYRYFEEPQPDRAGGMMGRHRPKEMMTSPHSMNGKSSLQEACYWACYIDQAVSTFAKKRAHCWRSEDWFLEQHASIRTRASASSATYHPLASSMTRNGESSDAPHLDLPSYLLGSKQRTNGDESRFSLENAKFDFRDDPNDDM